MLASGRTKIPGLKVRMELAWQKEREEHQRLLQETATLARDLRQTLFEVRIKLKPSSLIFKIKICLYRSRENVPKNDWKTRDDKIN